MTALLDRWPAVVKCYGGTVDKFTVHLVLQAAT